MRLARIFLVAVTIAGIVFSSAGSFFAVQKAKAGPTPPKPADYTLKITSSDTLFGTIRISATTGAGSQPREFMFTILSDALGVRNFSGGGQIPSYNGRRANDNDVIKGYKLTDPSNLWCQSGANRDDLYMVAVKYTGADDLYHFAGIYSSSTTPPTGGDINRLFNRIPDSSFGWGGMCNNIHNSDPVAEVIIKRANSNTYGNAVVLLQISEGDRITRCNSLERRWEEFKTAVRQLMEPTGPIALQAPASKTTENPYWSQSVGVSIKWVDFAVQIKNLFTSDNSVFDSTYDVTVDLNLTAAGEAKAAEISNLVSMMRTDFTVLKQSYPGNTWPDGCVKLKVFKWDSNSPNPPTYANLDAFSTDLEKAYLIFQKFMASRDEPITTGDNICGNLTMNNMFQYLFCKLGELTHALSSSVLRGAVGWLNNSIGLETGQLQFAAPKTDVSTIPSNNAPATTTPGGLNISGTMKINDQTKYNQLKNASERWAKINQAGATGSTITATATFSNWNDSARTVSVKFTTTDVVPSGWSNIRIYGGTGSGATGVTTNYDVSTPYPITGAFNFTSQ